jgi:protein-disulfide isomerase
MTEKFLNVAVALAVGCAVLLTGMTVKRELNGGLDQQEGRDIPEWRSYAESDHAIGASHPAVTAVVFSDYQCPFCRILNAQLDSVLRADSSLRIVFRQFPLEGHAIARPAARAALCAGEQEQFRAFHNALFASATDAEHWDFQKIATQVGIESEALRKCLASERPDSVIDADIRAGRQLGVQGTPTFLINDRLYVGLPPNLTKLIRKAKPSRFHWPL